MKLFKVAFSFKIRSYPMFEEYFLFHYVLVKNIKDVVDKIYSYLIKIYPSMKDFAVHEIKEISTEVTQDNLHARNKLFL